MIQDLNAARAEVNLSFMSRGFEALTRNTLPAADWKNKLGEQVLAYFISEKGVDTIFWRYTCPGMHGYNLKQRRAFEKKIHVLPIETLFTELERN